MRVFRKTIILNIKTPLSFYVFRLVYLDRGEEEGMSNHDIFLRAIHEKKKVELIFKSQEKGVIKRRCIPFDFGPARISKTMENRYHFYDLDSPEGSHTLSILPEQLIEIKLLEDFFDPANYVNWIPKWHIKRDWGKFS